MEEHWSEVSAMLDTLSAAYLATQSAISARRSRGISAAGAEVMRVRISVGGTIPVEWDCSRQKLSPSKQLPPAAKQLGNVNAPPALPF